MAFVVDASIVGCWALVDERHAVADKALELIRSEEAAAPELLWFEIRNILVVNERRKRLTEAGTHAFLQRLAVLPIVEDRSPNEAEVMRLARAYKLSVYDAAYLELARRKKIPLATLDDALAGAARKEGVGLVR